MAEDDEQSPPPFLKVVSENPNAPDKAGREIIWARERAQRALSELAATILRTVAGSETAARDIVRRLSELVDAQNDVRTLTGRWLSPADELEALRLPEAEFSGEDSADRRRRWQRDHGFEQIVQGALRLAAHQVLGEEPHFGGKYSKRAIESGIADIEQSRRPPATPPRMPKRSAAAKWTAPPTEKVSSAKRPEPPARKKPWSSRDSQSWRDLKKD